MNKIDQTGAEPRVERGACDTIDRVFVSARTGAGLAGLRELLADTLLSGKASAHFDQ